MQNRHARCSYLCLIPHLTLHRLYDATDDGEAHGSIADGEEGCAHCNIIVNRFQQTWNQLMMLPAFFKMHSASMHLSYTTTCPYLCQVFCCGSKCPSYAFVVHFYFRMSRVRPLDGCLSNTWVCLFRRSILLDKIIDLRYTRVVFVYSLSSCLLILYPLLV